MEISEKFIAAIRENKEKIGCAVSFKIFSKKEERISISVFAWMEEDNIKLEVGKG